MTLLLPDTPTSNVSPRTTCFTTGLLGHVSLDQLRLYSWRLHDGWGLPCDKQNDERPSVHNWESQEDSPCGCQSWTFAEITTVKSRELKNMQKYQTEFDKFSYEMILKKRVSTWDVPGGSRRRVRQRQSPTGWSFFKTQRQAPGSSSQSDMEENKS